MTLLLWRREDGRGPHGEWAELDCRERVRPAPGGGPGRSLDEQRDLKPPAATFAKGGRGDSETCARNSMAPAPGLSRFFRGASGLRPDFGQRVMRILSSSMTEKCPAQSPLNSSAAAARPATPAGEDAFRRNRMTPAVAGSPKRKASSPKSLSKVMMIRASACARARTSRSAIPGASALTQTTSCPLPLGSLTASPGKFSSARMRIRQTLSG